MSCANGVRCVFPALVELLRTNRLDAALALLQSVDVRAAKDIVDGPSDRGAVDYGGSDQRVFISSGVQ
jgi:hypothetical protein